MNNREIKKDVLAAPKPWLIAIEGWPFLLVGLVAALLGRGLHYPILTWVGIGWTLFVACFFRNPHRASPSEDGVIISPADGRVIAVDTVEEPHFLNRPMKRVSIFMSVANAHINRIPVSGRVDGQRHVSGKFLCASLEKASMNNERNAILISRGDWKMVCVQVAGLIARRIVSYAREGEDVTMGSRYGLIRFGSRVDLYFPVDTPLTIFVGDRVKAGTSILGRVS